MTSDATASSGALDRVKVGIVSVSDRASTGVYEDKGLPALKDWLTRALKNPIEFESRLIADEQVLISQALIELADMQCALVLTTGRLLIKAPREQDIQAYIREWLARLPDAKGDIRLTVDIDPYSFL